MRHTIFTVLLITILTLMQGYAQTNENMSCINNLATASTLYDKAQFTEAVALLEPCLKSGQLKKNEADAYRILGLCYQQMNNEAQTNEAISKLLKANTKYQLFPYNDPKDFTKAVNAFTVESKLTLGVKAGFNFSLPNITKAYSIKPATLEIQSERSQFLGLTGDYFLKGKSSGINFWATSGSLAFSENVTFNDVEKINFNQELKFADLGFEFKVFPLKKSAIQAYFGLGANALIQRSAISNIIYTNSYLNTKTESSRDMKAEGAVNSAIINGIADVGINTKAGKGIFGLGLQYARAFSLINNPDKRYDNIEYTLANQWVDSDVKLNYLNVYASYSFPLLWRVYK